MDEQIKKLKLIYLSAHDSTLAAILTALDTQSKTPVGFAAVLKIELYLKEGSTGKEEKDFYVRWIYNDTPLDIDGICPKDKNFACPFPEIKSAYETFLYDGDVDLVCANGESPGGNKIWILFLVLALLVFVIFGGYLLCKYMKNKRKLKDELHR